MEEPKKGIFKKILTIIISLLVGLAGGIVINASLTVTQEGEVQTVVEVKTTPDDSSMELGEETTTTLIEGDRGELEEAQFPTVEEIDGGLFEDEFTGVSSLPAGTYADLGAVEVVDTSSVEAFKSDVLGRCLIANNIYGAQCVSLARVFWHSYAGRDVSTCGTGLAKGMMKCAEQNAGDDFEIIYDVNKIIAGTWVVTDGATTGHICMALGPVTNGYVACLGQNQSGASCGKNVGGSAANIINLSMKNFLGGYIPKNYIPVVPPELPTTSAGF